MHWKCTEADGADRAGSEDKVSEVVKAVRTCQNSLGQNGTRLGLLLLLVGPDGDKIGGQAFMEHYSAIALQKCSTNVNALYSKVFQAQLKAARWFEQQHFRTLKDFDFQRGSLVLMRNTQIEKSLNKKMRARYIEPLIVVSRNYGGAYILSELDGTVLHRPITAFRLLPYFPHKSIPLPPDFIDIDNTRL
jgi:hypothetical protein